MEHTDDLSRPLAQVGSLPAFESAMPLSTPCREVYEIFSTNPGIPGVIVLGADRCIHRLISRHRFMEVFSQPYRAEVYFGRPLEMLLHDQFAPPLCVEASASINDAAQAALARERDLFHEPIAVRHDHGVYQILDTQSLLHALANLHAFQFSELQAAKDSLVQAEKLASLGGLVAGVAHEINTPIGVSLSAASYLSEQIETFSKLVDSQQVRKADLATMISNSREASNIILKNMERAAALVRSFKQVAADQTSENRRTFDLRQTIGEILFSLSPSFKHTSVDLTSEIPDGIEMDCFPGALAQIVSNLALNSLTHAFDESQPGKILVTATVKPGASNLKLTIEDNGKGIPPEILGRVFDPFFTTRRNQGGTGLGLHIVHNLVHSTLGGTISVSSVVQQGTRFVIRIPMVTPGTDAVPSRGLS